MAFSIVKNYVNKVLIQFGKFVFLFKTPFSEALSQFIWRNSLIEKFCACSSVNSFVHFHSCIWNFYRNMEVIVSFADFEVNSIVVSAYSEEHVLILAPCGRPTKGHP